MANLFVKESVNMGKIESQVIESQGVRYSGLSVLGIFAPKGEEAWQTYSVGLQQTQITKSGNSKIKFALNVPGQEFESKRNFFISGFESEKEAQEFIENYKDQIPNWHIRKITSHAPIGVEDVVDPQIKERMILSQRVYNPVTKSYVVENGCYKYQTFELHEQFIEDHYIDKKEQVLENPF